MVALAAHGMADVAPASAKRSAPSPIGASREERKRLYKMD